MFKERWKHNWKYVVVAAFGALVGATVVLTVGGRMEQWAIVADLVFAAFLVVFSYFLARYTGELVQSNREIRAISEKWKASEERWQKITMYPIFANERSDVASRVTRVARELRKLWERRAHPAETEALYEELLCDARLRRLAGIEVLELERLDDFKDFNNRFFHLARGLFPDGLQRASDPKQVKALGEPVVGKLNDIVNTRLRVDLQTFDEYCRTIDSSWRMFPPAP